MVLKIFSTLKKSTNVFFGFTEGFKTSMYISVIMAFSHNFVLGTIKSFYYFPFNLLCNLIAGASIGSMVDRETSKKIFSNYRENYKNYKSKKKSS